MFAKLKCLFGYHAWFVIGRCGVASRHVGCRHCHREWGMNHDARALLPWDAELAQFHEETFGYRPTRRLS
jgi:hypothetical protein